MSEYVPTTEDVRDFYGGPDEQFYRWLASVKAEALREAAAEIVQAGDVAYKSPISWLRWRAVQIQEGHTA